MRYFGASAVSVVSGLVDGWWSAFLRSGITLRFMPDLVRRSSSFLRSSSTRTSGRVWGRVGSLRRGCGEASQRQKSLRRAPAQRTIGGVGRAGVCACWGFQPWWLSPVGSFSSPGTGGDQEPGGGATGDSLALLLNLTFACCTPTRTLVGLRLPGEENDPTSAGELCAALGPGSDRAIRFSLLNSAFGATLRFGWRPGRAARC